MPKLWSDARLSIKKGFAITPKHIIKNVLLDDFYQMERFTMKPD